MGYYLTAKFVNDPDLKMGRYFDDKIPGLHLIVAKKRRKFSYRYKIPGTNKRTEYIIGDAHLFSRKKIEQEVAKIQDGLREGILPQEPVIASQKLESEQQVQNDEKTLAAIGDKILNSLEEIAVAQEAKGNVIRPGTRTVGEYKRQFRRDFKEIRQVPMEELDRKMVSEWYYNLAGGEKFVTANRCLALLSRLFSDAISRGLIDVNGSPTTFIKKMVPDPNGQEPLTKEQIRVFWKRTGNLGGSVKNALRLTLLTGVRIKETCRMEWHEIDFEEKIWTIPPLKFKGRRYHVVPLSDLALQVLKDQKNFVTDHPFHCLSSFVFPARRFNAKVPYLEDCRKALGRVQEDVEPSNRYTPHALRKTAATAFGAIGIRRDIIRRVLGHATDKLDGIYNKNDYLNEKRDAMQRYADYLNGLIHDGAYKVVKLRKLG